MLETLREVGLGYHSSCTLGKEGDGFVAGRQWLQEMSGTLGSICDYSCHRPDAVASGLKVFDQDALVCAGSRDMLAWLDGDPRHLPVQGNESRPADGVLGSLYCQWPAGPTPCARAPTTRRPARRSGGATPIWPPTGWRPARGCRPRMPPRRSWPASRTNAGPTLKHRMGVAAAQPSGFGRSGMLASSL